MTDEQYEEIMDKVGKLYEQYPFISEEESDQIYNRLVAKAGFNLGFRRGIIEGYEKGRDKVSREVRPQFVQMMVSRKEDLDRLWEVIQTRRDLKLEDRLALQRILLDIAILRAEEAEDLAFKSERA